MTFFKYFAAQFTFLIAAQFTFLMSSHGLVNLSLIMISRIEW